MKRRSLLLFALAMLGLAACKRDVIFTAGSSGTVITTSPTPLSADMGRGDVVVFTNNDDRIHRIFVGTGAPGPTSTSTTIYPAGSGAGRPNTYTWAIPAATKPPATYTWTCTAHTGESGTITIKP